MNTNKFLVLVFGILVTLTFVRADVNVPVVLDIKNSTLTLTGDNLAYSLDLGSLYNFTENQTNNVSLNKVLIIKLTGQGALSLEDLLKNMTSFCSDSLFYVSRYIECNLTVSKLNDTELSLQSCNSSLYNANNQLSFWTTEGLKYQISNPSMISTTISNAKTGMIIWIVIALAAGIGGTYWYIRRRGTTNVKEDKSMEY